MEAERLAEEAAAKEEKLRKKAGGTQATRAGTAAREEQAMVRAHATDAASDEARKAETKLRISATAPLGCWGAEVCLSDQDAPRAACGAMTFESARSSVACASG